MSPFKSTTKLLNGFDTQNTKFHINISKLRPSKKIEAKKQLQYKLVV